MIRTITLIFGAFIVIGLVAAAWMALSGNWAAAIGIAVLPLAGLIGTIIGFIHNYREDRTFFRDIW